MSFAPTHGSLLAVPYPKEVKLLKRDSWDQVGSLAEDSVKANLTIAAFSPDSSHVAAACDDGTIVIFNVHSRETVNVFRQIKRRRICSLQWNPVVSEVSLVYADDEGYVGMVEAACPTTAPKSTSAGKV